MEEEDHRPFTSHLKDPRGSGSSMEEDRVEDRYFGERNNEMTRRGAVMDARTLTRHGYFH